MINASTLDELNRMGFGADIDSLESYVESLQNAAAIGKPIVTDTVYDQHINLLRKLRPESGVANRNWELDEEELDDNDKLLKNHPMISIRTIQDMEDLNKFKSIIANQKMELTASIKLNGHAVRAVYRRGRLVAGSTRGRYKKGRDITRHLKQILPNNIDKWKHIELVEIRGEVLVSLDNFEQLKHILKTPLSSVTSLIRDSATDSDIKMLDCICYRVLSSQDLGLRRNWDELSYIAECGFKIPDRLFIEGVNYYNIESKLEDCIHYFEELYYSEKLGYATDGIVVSVDNYDLFYSLGTDGNTRVGNFALKMGRVWESNVYSSTIIDIEFVYGKSYITPKAIIEPVITVTGVEVSTVPLYNISVMEKLGLIPGEVVYFKFGGETGVTCCTAAGEPISSL